MIQEGTIVKCVSTGSSLLFCLPHQWEHFFTRLTTWHARSWSQNETMYSRHWLDVFWPLCPPLSACQDVTFWTVYHRTCTLQPGNLDISLTIFAEVWSNGGLVIGNVRSKTKTIYLPKSVKVSFRFVRDRVGWECGGLGVGWWENTYTLSKMEEHKM